MVAAAVALLLYCAVTVIVQAVALYRTFHGKVARSSAIRIYAIAVSDEFHEHSHYAGVIQTVMV